MMEEEQKPGQFKIGNQFWRKRSKHGRDAIIESPGQLAEAADEYFMECEENPIVEQDFRGAKTAEVQLTHPKVFLKGEFARFCGLSEWRLIDDLKQKSNDFSQVITRIEGIIRDQKYSYAVCGMFSATIVSRDLGLTDKKDLTSKGEKIQLPPIIVQNKEAEDVVNKLLNGDN